MAIPAHIGLKPLATQHLLALHYFKSVSDSEIVVEWQQIASHGRRGEGEDFANPTCKIESRVEPSELYAAYICEGEWAVEDCRNQARGLVPAWRFHGG
jgi:scytalone dehydratase